MFVIYCLFVEDSASLHQLNCAKLCLGIHNEASKLVEQRKADNARARLCDVTR